MPEGLVIDSIAESASNVQVDLLAEPFAVREIRTPTPPLQPRWAEPADADGEVLAATRYQNREITIDLEIVPTDATASARAATARTALLSLADKVAKVNRENGTLRRTLPSGEVFTFDLLTADSIDPPWDIEWDVANALKLTLKFTAKPFARGAEISGTTDTFASNTIADYTVSGTGASISGGLLVVSSVTAKTWLHHARRFIDGTVTRKFTTGAAVTTWSDQVIGKAVDASNHLSVQMTQAGALSILKTVRGTPTTLSTLAGANLTIRTAYWLRLVMVSNVITGELWTTDPSLGGSPARTVTHTLAGGDITTYGEGVDGYAGFAMTPGGTDWTYDDFSALWRTQEKTLPVLTLTMPGPDGDAPALGRLVLTELTGADQQRVVWGRQSRYYNSAATAGLFYEAEALTPMNTAAVASLSGASGGRVVTEGSLTPNWAAVLSTQMLGGSHLTHVSEYRVWARIHRPTSNAGAVSLAFEWSLGVPYAWQRNDVITYNINDGEGAFTLVDLGLVSLAPIQAGAQRWEGRVIAKSTVAGDDLSVDSLDFIPTERSGMASSLTDLVTPTAYVTRHEFPAASGSLNGAALAIGGTWATAGDTDFTFGGGYVSRSSPGDPTTGRRAIASGSTATTCAARIDMQTSGHDPTQLNQRLLIIRYVDDRNLFYVRLMHNVAGDAFDCEVGKLIGGVDTVLRSFSVPAAYDDDMRVVLAARDSGDWRAWVYGTADSPRLSASGNDTDLATGRTLASGRCGFRDYSGGAGFLRSFRNWATWLPQFDAAMFANQSFMVGPQSVLREDPAGATWGPVSQYAGDYLTVPPGGSEGRTARLFVRGSRLTPDGVDTAIDDVSAQLFLTPQHLAMS